MSRRLGTSATSVVGDAGQTRWRRDDRQLCAARSTGPRRAAPEPITADPPAAPAVAPLPVTLSDVTFLHWRYEPEMVRPLLPPDTHPDSFDGAAYVGLVALRMRSYGEFVQFNVRCGCPKL